MGVSQYALGLEANCQSSLAKCRAGAMCRKVHCLGSSSGYFGFFSDYIFLTVHARHAATNLQHNIYFWGSSIFDCRLFSCTISKIRMDFVECVIVQSKSAQFVGECAMASD